MEGGGGVEILHGKLGEHAGLPGDGPGVAGEPAGGAFLEDGDFVMEVGADGGPGDGFAFPPVFGSVVRVVLEGALGDPGGAASAARCAVRYAAVGRVVEEHAVAGADVVGLCPEVDVGALFLVHLAGDGGIPGYGGFWIVVKEAGCIAIGMTIPAAFNDSEGGLADGFDEGLGTGGTGDVAGAGDFGGEELGVDAVDESGLLVSEEHVPGEGGRMVAVGRICVGDPDVGRGGPGAVEVDAAVELEEDVLGGSVGPENEVEVAPVGHSGEGGGVGVVTVVGVVDEGTVFRHEGVSVVIGVSVGPVAAEHVDGAGLDTVLQNSDWAAAGAGPEGGGVGVFPAEGEVAAGWDDGGAVDDVGGPLVEAAAVG